MITHNDMVANILATFDEADPGIVIEGSHWYRNARQWCRVQSATRMGVTTEQTAAIVAHLSPMSSWQRNKMLAETMIATGDCRHLSGVQIKKARAVLMGEPIESTFGPDRVKVWCFWRNIMGDTGLVTVDRHAAAIAGWEGSSLSKGWYRKISAAYVEAAVETGFTPAELQAITWCQRRGTGE